MCTLYSCVLNASLVDILERQQQQAAVEKRLNTQEKRTHAEMREQ